jgi:hypothetical protein
MTDHQQPGDTTMPTTTPISRDQMATHVSTGRAHPWTHPLHGAIPTAAHIDDTWYVVLDGTDHYQPAPPQLAAVLTHAHDLLTAANQAIAQADAHP